MPSVLNIEVFLEDRLSDLRRIASRTSGELSYEDLGNEAWVIADKLAKRRGFPVDLANLDDQEQVLGWLYAEFVKHADKSIRFAERLDRDSTDEDGKTVENVLVRLLRAHEASDPLVLLQATEEQRQYMALVRSSYSQATAYVLLLLRIGRDELATYLMIGRATLAARIRRAAYWLTQQPSIFDGVEAIDEDFMPARGHPKPARKVVTYIRKSWDLWPSHAWTRGI